MKHPQSPVVLAAFGLCSLAVCSGCASFAKEPLPGYTIYKAVGPIAIDGQLDEASWRAAVEVGPFEFPWWVGGEQEQTVVKLLWDDDNLYLGYFCVDRHISAFETERDAAVYNDDTVEAFIAPNPSQVERYMNFEINCLGVCMDSRPGTPNRKAWNAEGLECVGKIWGTLNNDADTDLCWTMEVKIPLKSFVCYAKRFPPRPGDVWRMGLNRCGGETNAQYSQWSNSGTETPAFHVPERFGVVVFSDVGVQEVTRPAEAAD